MTQEPVGRPPGVVAKIFGGSADYVWGLRQLFAFCLIIFSACLFFGYYLGDSIPVEMFEDLLESFPDLETLSLPEIFLFIVANNIFKSLVWMMLGVLLGIPPLLFTILNGFLIGWLSYTVSQESGLGFAVAAILPHGVIEVPSILLCMAAGMALGYQLVNSLRGRGSLRAELSRAFRLFVRRIIPLLLLAATVEVVVTPLVVLLLGYIP